MSTARGTCANYSNRERLIRKKITGPLIYNPVNLHRAYVATLRLPCVPGEQTHATLRHRNSWRTKTCNVAHMCVDIVGRGMLCECS
jgi:hypothetical protein